MTGGTEERTVWQGTPSQLINLPSYILLLLGAALATAGLLFVRNASRPDVIGEEPNPVFTWMIAGIWGLWLLMVLVQYIQTRSTRYQITTERLRVTTGVFSTLTEELELRRVRDSSIEKSFFARMMGMGDIHLMSADTSTPRVTIRAVRNPDDLQATIRRLVRELYDRYRVREIDVM